MELGKEAMRYRKQFLDQVMPVEDVHILHAIEFAWEKSAYQWAHVVMPALMAYKNTWQSEYYAKLCGAVGGSVARKKLEAEAWDINQWNSHIWCFCQE
jgi:hypothetical protein